MTDEQLRQALLGAFAIVTALMLEAGERLRDERTDRSLEESREVVRVAPDVVVIEEPETTDTDGRRE